MKADPAHVEHIFITGEITEKKYKFFAKKVLETLEYENCGIVLHLFSDGGEVIAGAAIYDIIATHPTQVTAIVDGNACSCASAILQAADIRLMMPHAYLLIHDGSTIISGTKLEVKSAYKYEDIIDQQFYDMYTARMAEAPKFKSEKQPQVQAQRYLNRLVEMKGNVYLTATQCIELGLADAIIPISGRSR